ncbi:hypothetical protein OCF84_21655 (plasmid) [Shewanella xiamenensis]|uniref:Uncharacterized protein n=1 Tax=Shewanella xiamenensis TaxID=332186 RepID=A0ABT6UDH1_9GAMM|nr:hypothetical protein [Shewanella xiamenensis]MDI5832515.1 hypothetical protein [Shewanella xiamenensis]WHF57866.1 hypothetical protein OCF84_21655 [Shewanella xiamenensis]
MSQDILESQNSMLAQYISYGSVYRQTTPALLCKVLNTIPDDAPEQVVKLKHHSKSLEASSIKLSHVIPNKLGCMDRFEFRLAGTTYYADVSADKSITIRMPDEADYSYSIPDNLSGLRKSLDSHIRDLVQFYDSISLPYTHIFDLDRLGDMRLLEMTPLQAIMNDVIEVPLKHLSQNRDSLTDLLDNNEHSIFSPILKTDSFIDALIEDVLTECQTSYMFIHSKYNNKIDQLSSPFKEHFPEHKRIELDQKLARTFVENVNNFSAIAYKAAIERVHSGTLMQECYFKHITVEMLNSVEGFPHELKELLVSVIVAQSLDDLLDQTIEFEHVPTSNTDVEEDLTFTL